ncbi:MAG: hypothetical protein ABI550_06205, partial [Ignavibacteriaceae bacterium]
ELNLNETPKEAQLQLMADTYATLFINDEYVDQVYARRSLSLLVDYKRIKFLDISKFLKKGKNIIKVQVENFNKNGAAGINIISKIVLENDTLNILTGKDQNWQGKSDNKTWQNVVEKDYRFEVIAPNFAAKRTSWIER